VALRVKLLPIVMAELIPPAAAVAAATATEIAAELPAPIKDFLIPLTLDGDNGVPVPVPVPVLVSIPVVEVEVEVGVTMWKFLIRACSLRT
jgi:hypothetical protein